MIRRRRKPVPILSRRHQRAKGELPNRLKVLRAERQLTQRDVALQVQFSQDRYWRIENGYAKPTLVEVRQLAKTLSVPPGSLGFQVFVARSPQLAYIRR